MMLSCFVITVVLGTGMNVETLTADLHIETGMAYIDQGLTDEAFGEFTSALEISDDAVEAHLGLARVAVINSSWETAEEEFLVYMDAAENDYRAPLELSSMLLTLRGRTEDALMYAQKALSLAPMNGECWMLMARAESRLGNLEEATRWFTRVIIDEPLLAMDARVGMGSMLFQQGDLSSAREILLPASAAGVSEADHLLALIYLEQNDNLRAMDSINRYLDLEPNGLWADSARVCLEEISSGSLLSN